METLEERLRTELGRLSPPGDPSGVVDRVLRRGARRYAAHRAGIVLLTVLVIAGSVTGFYGLTRVFGGRESERVGSSTVGNGRITLVQPEADGSSSLISTVEPDGSDWVELVRVEGVVTDLDWSPDGRRLAYGRHNLFVLDLDSGVSYQLNEAGQFAYAPTWSPDGSRIAFAVERDGDDGPADAAIYISNADGSDATLVTEASSLGWTDWSPDGSHILFGGPGPAGADQGWDIYVMSTDGSDVTNLTNSATVDLDPSWSPDGTTILFRSRRDLPPGWTDADGAAPDELYLMAPDGSDVRRLTNDSATDQSPVWSPDGTRIAFTSYEGQDYPGVYTMRPDGTDRTSLAGVTAIAIAWQPLPEGEAIDPSPAETTEPTPSGSPAVDNPVRIEGIPFPVCDVDAIQWRFDVDGIGQAFTFEEAPEEGCQEGVERPQYLGVTTRSPEGIDRADAYFGPLTRCTEETGCWLYAAVELGDADDVDEILLGAHGSPAGLEVWLVDVRLEDGAFVVEPFEAVCPENTDCDPMMVRTIDWELPGLAGLSCRRFGADGSYSGDGFFEWSSETGDGWIADGWVFEDGRARVLPLREDVSDADPRAEFTPSNDVEICLQSAYVAPSVLAD